MQDLFHLLDIYQPYVQPAAFFPQLLILRIHMKFNFFFSIVNGRRTEADDSSQLVSLCCQKYETTSFEVGKKRPQRAESLLCLRGGMEKGEF